MQVIKDKENKVGDDGWAIIANLANGSVSREEMDIIYHQLFKLFSQFRLYLRFS